MKSIKYITGVLLLAVTFSCDSLVGDPDLPIPLDETLSNTGAFLRVKTITTAAFDLADANAAYEFVGEYFDGEGASLLESVTFYASYRSFALPGVAPTIYPESELFTIPSSSFAVDATTGLPTANISVPLADVVAGIPQLAAGDVGVEDRFTLRWALNLTDGRSFSADDASPALSGGFYRSPYAAAVSTVQALANDEFVGDYTFTRQTVEVGPFESPFFGGAFGTWDYIFGNTPFTGTLSVDPNNSLNGRVVDLPGPYPNSVFGLGPMTGVQLAIGRTAQVASTANVGVGCGLNIAIGRPSDDGIVEIDVNDDSSFILAFSENVNADCGRGSADIFFDVVKN